MFTTVQQMMGLGKPREAESADTRMGLLRRTEDQGRKKQNNNDQVERQKIYDYEQSTISVQSALLFLEGFLEARLDTFFQDEDSVSKTENRKSWLNPLVSNQNTSVANKAYRHAAEISGQSDAKVGKAFKKSEELRAIYQLIQDLRWLSDNGTEYLKIDTDSSFLEAISQAIAQLKP
jgi:hypothetical protein